MTVPKTQEQLEQEIAALKAELKALTRQLRIMQAQERADEARIYRMAVSNRTATKAQTPGVCR